MLDIILLLKNIFESSYFVKADVKQIQLLIAAMKFNLSTFSRYGMFIFKKILSLTLYFTDMCQEIISRITINQTGVYESS